ncbi:MAG: pitrilysin family protein, partial [Pseudomonadota bacterium]
MDAAQGTESGALDGIVTTTLPSGLRVTTHHMPHLETASLGVWVASGARSEDARSNGLSHLLEHMAFKGTGTRSAAQIAEEIENVGGDLNASTSYEVTAYYARVLKDDVQLGVELLTDILTASRMDEQDLAREKQVIGQEIAGAADTPDDVVFDDLQAYAYPEQALGRPILGTVETVDALTPDDLRAHLHSRYRAGDMIVAAAGNVDHAQITDQAAALADKLPPGRAPSVAPAQFGGGGGVTERPVEQTHVAVSFDGVSFRDPRYFAAQVFSGLFGGGISSRLFQRAREEKGLCYTIYSFASGYSDAGMFGVYAGTGGEAVDPLMGLVWGELNALAHDGPSADEVARSKAQLKAGLLMSLES